MQWVRAWTMLAVFAFAGLAFFLPALVRLGLLGAFLILHTQPDLLANRKVSTSRSNR